MLGARIVVAAVAALSIVPAAARAPLLDEQRGVLTLAPMLEKVTPAVVNISVSTSIAGQDNPLLRDPFFRRYFGLPDAVPRQELTAAGSGVIIDAGKGYVVTNHHVVKNAERISITLKDGRQFKATLVGSDAATDIALLKTEASGLRAVDLGDSDQLAVGDVVLAIGNPFGLGQTVTSGIVSALGRSGLNAENYEDFIQTDAPINPGNSGGALVNSKGEAIGINTAIIAPGGGNVGIGFAVPINMVKAIVRQLEQLGHVRRGRIGVAVQSITPDIAEAMKLPTTGGALVGSVEHGSSAERAGLKPGDAILQIDGRPVLNASDLRTRVGLREPGAKPTITYLRDGKQSSVPVVIEATKTTDLGTVAPQLAGAQFAENPAAEVTGVGVESVAEGSAAARTGLKAGDVIVGVNRITVRSIADLRDAIRAAGNGLVLRIQRGDAQILIASQR
ncbi:MAG: DegQ family serine endoprotease [Hyphomicrobiaceae bacterium]|nr:DegQ family serine endoprotease [Hyphomicrobiaceae bacterium]